MEEIIAFANRIGAKRIGIATCIGSIRETRVFVKVLKRTAWNPTPCAAKSTRSTRPRLAFPTS